METREGSSSSRSSAEIHDRTGLYIAIIALVLAGMGLGYEMAQNGNRSDFRALEEKNLDAAIKAAVAQSETRMQEQLAQAKAEANEAKVNSRVAVDEQKTLCAAVKANGIKNVDCH